MERYPIIEKGRIRGWLVDSAEFTGYNGRRYLWVTPDRAKRIDKYLRGPVLDVKGHKLNFARLFEDIPWPYVSVAWNLEDYVEWLKKKIPSNMKVVLNFSGGKDSVAAAKVLVEAGADVTLLYSHVSYLENPKNIDFVEKIANKLGANLISVEADKSIMKNMLEKGMPFRGNRWCTAQKVRPLKKVLKELKDYVRADGERMFESMKRFKRLSYHSPKTPKVFDFKRVRPIFLFTLADVVKTVRDEGAVHPDYLKGLPRVACAFCPYKTLHEMGPEVWEEVEDPGLLEDAIKASYKRLGYEVPWEDFSERHMWRFSPKLANVLYKIQNALGDEEDLSARFVNEGFSSLWREELPKPRVLGPEEAYEMFVKLLNKVYSKSSGDFEEAEKALGEQT
ncbi:MAG: phosphoadenosine phosphosulfate reductase family protein [Crenarchaeota archaeon]|nr:phosphoadenosine phosphosulfate reductase family protein [Thermoproteota archaeon]